MTPVTISTRGEIVIPKKMRERYGLNRAGIRLIEQKDGILIQPIRESPEEAMKRWAQEARGLPKDFDLSKNYYEEMMEENIGKHLKNIR